MKQLTKAALVFGFVMTFATRTLVGQEVFIFDELGNGTTNGNPLLSVVGPDPSGGVAGNVLIYYMSPTFSGDVVLMEPGASAPSDLIRFFPIVGGTAVIFYSDLPEPGDAPDPADSGLPAINPLGAIVLNEIGAEGNNGAFYTPNEGDPGFDAAGTVFTYHFISDIPEPSSASLLLTGGVALWLKRSRSRVKSHAT